VRPKDVRALLVSDLHLSQNRPPARNDSDWFAAMERPLKQLTKLQEQYQYDVPILIPGDVFETWKSTPELINWAIAFLPNRIYAVPGNHDLPYHSFDELRKSPFWTLMRAKKIELLMPGQPVAIGDLVLHGFPHGFPVKPNSNPHTLALDVAVIHSFIWTKKTGYTNGKTPEEFRLKNYKEKLRGYNVAVFGDNHSPFNAKFTYEDDTVCRVHNCGTLIRRDSNEIDLKPSIGLLLSDATILRQFIDVADDEFVDASKLEKLISGSKEIDLVEFVDELKKDRGKDFDFSQVVLKWIRENQTNPNVKRLLLGAIGK
jgi:UDP-2,3-diacylglucosamine pyrophosphatase LpxH